jgi:hypothetical protein
MKTAKELVHEVGLQYATEAEVFRQFVEQLPRVAHSVPSLYMTHDAEGIVLGFHGARHRITHRFTPGQGAEPISLIVLSPDGADNDGSTIIRSGVVAFDRTGAVRLGSFTGSEGLRIPENTDEVLYFLLTGIVTPPS